MRFPDSFTVISDEISQDLPSVLRFVREFRLSGFELRSMFGRAFKDLTAEDIAEIRRVSRDEGLRIHGCATPVFKCPLDDAAAIQEHREHFLRALDVARTLETDLVRVFTFLRQPTVDPARWPRIAEHLQELAELARGSGIRIGVENETSCLVASGEELMAVLDLLPNEQVGIIWDPCNVVYLPGAPLPVTAIFERLWPRLFHIHIKDAIRRAHPTPTVHADSVPVGLGQVDWFHHLGEIKRHGYQGWLSLETHWRPEPISEEMLHLPAGYAFSKGGEEATRNSLVNLQALCALLD